MLQGLFDFQQKVQIAPDAFALGLSTATISGEEFGIFVETPMMGKYTVVKAKHLAALTTYL
jgi:hypothetical protein